jgi:hypothetical protein
MTLRMEGHAVHDDGAYVPPEIRALAEHDPPQRFVAWMCSTGDDEPAALERGVEDAIGDAVARAEAAPCLIRTRSKMASTPAEAEPGPKRLSLPAYRPWFYDIVRGSSAVLMRTVFRMTAEGVENVPAEGGVVLAPMHRSYVDTLAVGVPIKPRRFRAMAKYELFLVPLLGRVIAFGGGFR